VTDLAGAGAVCLVAVLVEAFVSVTATRPTHRVPPPRRRALLRRHVLAITTTLARAARTGISALPFLGTAALGPVLARVVVSADVLTAWPDRS
jgi:hypothetical protein